MITSTPPQVANSVLYTVKETFNALGISKASLYLIPFDQLPWVECQDGHRRYQGHRIRIYWSRRMVVKQKCFDTKKYAV